MHTDGVLCTQFFRGLFGIPHDFVAFNTENELIETEKSLQKDGHGELEVRRPTKKLSKAGKVRRQYCYQLASLLQLKTQYDAFLLRASSSFQFTCK